ncbi:hypothetical protein [Streptomyces sp. NPDC007172]
MTLRGCAAVGAIEGLWSTYEGRGAVTLRGCAAAGATEGLWSTYRGAGL